MFLEISQNSQKNTCARDSFLNKVAGLRPATLSKKNLWHKYFPVNIAKFLRIPFSTEHLQTTAFELLIMTIINTIQSEELRR